MTFLLFAPNSPHSDPIRVEYQETFGTFGHNASAIYQRYGTEGLNLLQDHQVEGLGTITRYENGFQLLQPYMELDIIFQLFRTHGDRLEVLLKLFQPETIAHAYDEFGENGLHYIIDEPEVYFLLQRYGDRLLQLVNAKGPIMFSLIRTYQPEFLELYYDDALFTAISHFGIDGLLAFKTYRGMASKIFRLFAEDERFAAILRRYGYQQTIPVLYHFYHTQGAVAELNDRITTFSISQLFQTASDRTQQIAQFDQATREHTGLDRANWALQRLYEDGNSFLRQFAISEDGSVTFLQIVSITDFLENAFIGNLKNLGPPSSIASPSQPESCEQFAAALDILGLLPYESLLSQQVRCLYLQAGLANAQSVEDIKGLLLLDQHEELANRYGEAVIPFIIQYGDRGIQLLQETNGEILQLVNMYGESLIGYTARYGVTTFEMIREYGEQALEAIMQTDGAVIPYIQQYGSDVFPILAQPDGLQLLLLCPAFGDDILQYAARYPGEFFQALLYYGSPVVRALRAYNKQAMTLARKHGNDVFQYLGIYGNKALRLVRTGKMGVVLARLLPDEFWQQSAEQLFRHGTVGIYLRLFFRHPGTFHAYIGQLGNTLLSVKPLYIQLIFWTFVMLLFLSVLTIISKLLIKFFLE